MSLPDLLKARSGIASWWSLQAGFPWERFLELYGGNLTWLVPFAHVSGPADMSAALADRIERRVRVAHDRDTLIELCIFCRHFWHGRPDPDAYWQSELMQWTTQHQRKVDMLAERLFNYDNVLWNPMLEPKLVQQDFVERCRRYLDKRRLGPTCFAPSFRNPMDLKGFDVYFQAAGWPESRRPPYQAVSTDHDDRALRLRRPTSQVAYIESIPEDKALHVVSNVHIDGKSFDLWNFGLEIDWTQPKVLEALAARRDGTAARRATLDRLRVECDGLSREARRLGGEIGALDPPVRNLLTRAPEVLPLSGNQLLNLQTRVLKTAQEDEDG